MFTLFQNAALVNNIDIGPVWLKAINSIFCSEVHMDCSLVNNSCWKDIEEPQESLWHIFCNKLSQCKNKEIYTR